MAKKVQLLAFLTLSALLISCSAAQNSLTLPATPGLGIDKAQKKAFATLTISVPNSTIGPARKRHHYVSPATQSIAVAVSSVAGPFRTFYANLSTARNPKCRAFEFVVKCVLTFPLPTGKYTAGLSTFDGPVISGKPSGHELSADQNIPFNVRADKTNPIRVTLGGIPASVAFVPNATSQLTGSQQDGYTLPRCGARAQAVSVFGVDVDGNFILGLGEPTITVRAGSGLTVVSPHEPSPNLFTLVPPAPPNYPPGGSTVFVLGQANPMPGSGGRPVFAIVKVTFSSQICGVFTEFPVPTASGEPYGIAVGPDGAIWFTELTGNKIGRIPTTATAANPGITEYTVPTMNAHPWGIAAGGDQALWFTECTGNQIGRIPTTGTSILEFATTSRPAQAMGITAGPDGAMWFSERYADKIGRISTSGPVAVSEYSVPTASSGPQGITLGPDGALWFTEAYGNKIGRVPTAGTPFAEYPILSTNPAPRVITKGPDGNLWFSEAGASYIGKISVAGGTPQEFIPPHISDVAGITTGPDGALWAAEPDANLLYRVTTDGVISTYPDPHPSAGPGFILLGPDGNLWFTEIYANAIGRLQ